MKTVFAPGCALMIDRPRLGKELHTFLNREFGSIEEHLTCCRHEPHLPEGTQIINTCPGCDRRYRELYPGITTLSLWEVLAENARMRGTFPFPDYGGKKMTILDACPTRDQARVHQAIRTLLQKMNIQVVEPARTGRNSVCCGDSFYGTLPVAQVKEGMKQRAAEMPLPDVVVYCVSCCKAMHIGGKKPRYLVDLLFATDTLPGTFEPDEWHAAVNQFIAEH